MLHLTPGRSARTGANTANVKATIGRLKDFRRVATRYDKLACTFRDAVTIAAIYAFWP